MAKQTLVSFIVWLCVVFAAHSVACPSPFSLLSGRFCVYWNINIKLNWCDAAEFCLGIGGELAIDLDLIRAARNELLTTQAFIGLTDTLIERTRNQTGWQLTNGSIADLLESDWKPNTPDSYVSADDFCSASPQGISDVNFLGFNLTFLCQPFVTPNSSLFKRTAFLRLGNITPSYCYSELANVQIEFVCALRCAQRWQCRSALYNKADGRCRMLDFTDASVGNAIETDLNWSRLIKVY